MKYVACYPSGICYTTFVILNNKEHLEGHVKAVFVEKKLQPKVLCVFPGNLTKAKRFWKT